MSPASDEDLLARQSALQDEAREMLASKTTGTAGPPTHSEQRMSTARGIM